MFSCEVCQSKYVSISGLNKHFRNKHKDVTMERKATNKILYFCNSCDQSFNLKNKLKCHIKIHMKYNKHRRIICSFENCHEKFFTMNELTSHLRSIHNVDIELNSFNFNSMEDFYLWKKNVEEKEVCQYIRSTSKKKSGGKEYIYYYCHRSFDPRVSNNRCKTEKRYGSVKTGHVCPSNIKVHINNSKIEVIYCSTHLWHTKDLKRLRLSVEDRHKVAEKLIMGEPVNKILEDVQLTSLTNEGVKRINLLNKRDIHNIRRDFNIVSHSKKNKKLSNDNDYFNICKNIHTYYAEKELDSCIPNQTLLQESECEYIDIGIEEIENVIKNEKLKNKIMTVFDMIECANISEEDEAFINKHCDKIISKLNDKKNFSKL
ncbi:Zinc finger C2H2-type [Cinara cedri]|uniref:Zinc finger C2H2-type n=1 Tax=Cinara cedri TaxID=506608 RepID=A0A5E4M3W5_9HEMI|nr:Zinc finger C2H2-type [Cinara cedri]